MTTRDETLVQTVWEQARATQDHDPGEWRKDQCGAWIHRDQHDSPDSDYGWKILNVVPGSDDVPANLQAFHRDNDFDPANGRPQCSVTADRKDIAAGQQVGQPRNTRA
ncbi:MAG TPA: hypothetical protein VK973_02530 [Arenicellales bacterium]|nr:hypothetical protein [Arenicellales bacterium]